MSSCWALAQLVKRLSSWSRTLAPAPRTLGAPIVLALRCKAEESEVQDHPQLHIRFKATLSQTIINKIRSLLEVITLALGDRCYVEHMMRHRLLTKVSGTIPILQWQQLRAKRKVGPGNRGRLS